MGGHGEAKDHSGRIMLWVLGVAVVFYLLGMATRPAPAAAEDHRPAAGPGYSEPLPAQGNPDAPVVLVEVADYKCRFCRLRSGLVKRLMAEHREDVRFVFKHFPFVNPAGSELGAVAAMAANRQRAFWKYNDMLFRHQTETWTPERLTQWASELGLDAAKFEADLGDEALQDYVRKDKRAAELLRVRATPTLLVNGMAVPNDANADDVRMMVQDAIEDVRGILARGEANNVLDARAISAARRHPMGAEFSRLYMNNDASELGGARWDPLPSSRGNLQEN